MPKMILMRGGPGSGKSTLARALVKRIIAGRIYSSDDTFINPETGLYEFNPDFLAKAHGECLRDVANAMSGTRGSFVVDNTNSSEMEMAPYLALCNAFRYDCEVIRVRCDPEIAWLRQTHDVSREKFMKIHTKVATINVPKLWRKALWIKIRDVWTDGSDKVPRGVKVYAPYSGAICCTCRGTIVYTRDHEPGDSARYCDHEADTCECMDGNEKAGEPFGGLPPSPRCNCGVSMGLRGDHESQCAATYIQRG